MVVQQGGRASAGRRANSATRTRRSQVFSGGPVVSKQRQEGLSRLAQLVADLLPDNDAVAERNRILLARGVVAAADAYLLAWLDGDSGITCDEVVDFVTELFDSVAARVALSPTH